MLIKWVRCEVVDRDAFDRGQRGWSALAGLPGFLGQCGGLASGPRSHSPTEHRQSDASTDVAHVFGLWRSEADHRAFLTGPHDRLAADQAGSYSAIEVRLFERVLDIGGGFPARGSVVRLAHCRVRDGRRAHFEQAQASVWNPGMAAAPGMLGGVFAHGDSGFLVLTSWESADHHRRYTTDVFPDLFLRSGARDDLEAVAGAVIDLDPAWSVG